MAAQGPRLTLLGKIVIGLFLLACFYGAYYFFIQADDSRPVAERRQSGNQEVEFASGEQVTLGIAYGTEKERWLHWAVEQFAATGQGGRIRIDLIPMGSLAGAQAVVNGDRRIQVWSPASSAYLDSFRQNWRARHGGDPIIKGEALALSPMVFVMWAERYQAFKQRYAEISFKTLSQALAEPGGWGGIAGKPEWGLFKFGHTHPNQSNSGLMTLILLAYDYHDKCRELSPADLVNVEFQNWLRQLEGAVSGLSHSTGTMMRQMVLKGPSVYDALMVYENLAIDYLKNAEGRWGSLRVSYPARNMWNDNPYYILDVPWSTPAQRAAAEVFLDFLLSEPIQARSLQHGFRPGNPQVAVNTPDSPLVKYQNYGLRVELARVCEAPSAEVIENLLAGWQRARIR